MTNGRKISLMVVGFLILCVAVLGVLFLSQDTAGGASYSTDVSFDTTSTVTPTPSASPIPIPPASAATVSTALKQRSRAKAACGEWNRARKAFTLRLVPFSKNSAASPARSESEAVWLAAGRAWRRDTTQYKHKFGTLRDRMVNPGGSSNGVRWLPLARWVGWPEYTLSTLAAIIMRESSGIESNMNHQGSGAAGLLQLMPGWYCGSYYDFPDFNPLDPELNLYYGHLGWHVSGWDPWSG